jgi:hypothetical protein
MLFGRRRSIYEVRWGSAPDALPLPDGDPLGWPGRSFRVWSETRTHHARPWTAVELGIAVALRSLTQEVIVASAAHFEVLALRDGLTGLPNRERCRQILADTIAQAAPPGVCSVSGCSTSIISRPSTTRSATTRATSCSRPPARRIVGALPEERRRRALGRGRVRAVAAQQP